ncbi:MAG TPA: HNH endonuclease signature motif containing protein [Bdellovibrionales bacterium]|nr:HNH endonuclease signature motif containing protein [Bdellovibrionales bacterium]
MSDFDPPHSKTAPGPKAPANRDRSPQDHPSQNRALGDRASHDRALKDKALRLDDGELIRRLKASVHQERELAREILHYLAEVERRRLHVYHGHKNLFDFCVKFLGYSGSAAYRRIQSMRLLKQLPEAAPKLSDGTVNLSTLSKLQGFIRTKEKEQGQPLQLEEQRNLLSFIENKSQSEVERTLTRLAPLPVIPKPNEAPAVEPTLELRVNVKRAFKEKLERLKTLRGDDTARALEFAVDLALSELENRGRPADQSRKTQGGTAAEVNVGRTRAELEPVNEGRPAAVVAATETGLKLGVTKRKTPAKVALPPSLSVRPIVPPKKISKHISVEATRLVWERSGGQCEFIVPLSGQRCEARVFLEIDHIEPWKEKGSEPDNLRLVCGNHKHGAVSPAPPKTAAPADPPESASRNEAAAADPGHSAAAGRDQVKSAGPGQRASSSPKKAHAPKRAGRKLQLSRR